MFMSFLIRRRHALPLFATSACLLLLLLGAGSAHAASSAACSGDETGAIAPNLTNTPQTVSFTLDQTIACSSSTDPTITAGTVHSVGPVPLATCSFLTGGGPRTRTYRWNNGQTSTATYLATTTTGPGDLVTSTRTGLVTGGEFLGAVAVEHIVTPIDRSVCPTTGVPGYEGDVDLTITGLL